MNDPIPPFLERNSLKENSQQSTHLTTTTDEKRGEKKGREEKKKGGNSRSTPVKTGERIDLADRGTILWSNRQRDVPLNNHSIKTFVNTRAQNGDSPRWKEIRGSRTGLGLNENRQPDTGYRKQTLQKRKPTTGSLCTFRHYNRVALLETTALSSSSSSFLSSTIYQTALGPFARAWILGERYSPNISRYSWPSDCVRVQANRFSWPSRAV